MLRRTHLFIGCTLCEVMQGKACALVYLLGGISQRFGGKIKALASVGGAGEALIEVSLRQAVPAGFTKIIFVVSEATRVAFEQAYGHAYQGIPLLYALQTYERASRDKPWGTADALCVAASFLDCSFVVCNGDDLYGASSFADVVQHLTSSEDNAIVGYHLCDVLPRHGNANRAIVEIDHEGMARSIREELGLNWEQLGVRGISSDAWCSMNLFGLHSEGLHAIQKRVEAFRAVHADDRTKECLLPAEIDALIRVGEMRVKILAAHERWIGITYAEDVEKVRAELSCEGR